MAKRDKTEDLVKEIIHEEDWKRMNATAELLKRGPEAVRHLLGVLADENPRLRAEAALMLGRIKDRTAGVPIVELLTDPEPIVRTAAAEALQHVADDTALAVLVRMLEEPAHTGASDTSPPELSVLPPQQMGNLFLIFGKTEKGAVVTVNAEPADVAVDGSFKKTITIERDGYSILVIKAVDGAGNETIRRMRVFVETL